MIQTKEELENWYKNIDPWSYKMNYDDIFRKEKILSILEKYDTTLDIGCGEGFITTDLPANKIYGIELSDNASSRLPENVIRISKPEGKYDLVMTTGTLYQQYNHQQITNWVKQSASHHILVGGIKDWMIWSDFGKIIKEIEFKYREYTQIIRLYETTT
jgi:hypothetical protein